MRSKLKRGNPNGLAFEQGVLHGLLQLPTCRYCTSIKLLIGCRHCNKATKLQDFRRKRPCSTHKLNTNTSGFFKGFITLCFTGLHLFEFKNDQFHIFSCNPMPRSGWGAASLIFDESWKALKAGYFFGIPFSRRLFLLQQSQILSRIPRQKTASAQLITHGPATTATISHAHQGTGSQCDAPGDWLQSLRPNRPAKQGTNIEENNEIKTIRTRIKDFELICIIQLVGLLRVLKPAMQGVK